MSATKIYNSGQTQQGTPLLGTERVTLDGGGAVTSFATASQIVASPQPTSAALTAHAGGGQALATLLIVGYNKVGTVATINDSVQLPASAAGLEVTVVNATTNQLAVFPNVAGTDQINQSGVGSAFYVPGSSVAVFTSADTGDWFTPPQFGTFSPGAVLSATGIGFSNAISLLTDFNTVGFALSNGGILLPTELSAPAGSQITIFNTSGNTINIYATGGATIDGVAGTTGTTLTVAHRGAVFYKNLALKWVSSLFGAVSS